MSQLKALSQEVLEELRESVEQNLNLYVEGDFSELAKKNGWEVEVPVEVDHALLAQLNGTQEHGNPPVAVSNSLLVWNAFKGFSPNLAAEERIWVRLSHVECLPYARARWLNSGSDKETMLADIRKHFFAKGVNGVRDDHAISRLWWNARVASLGAPDDVEGGLKQILKTADYRQALVERSRISSRLPLVAGVLRALEREPWLTTEGNHRAFHVALNRLGGGVVYEIMSESEIDHFMARCVQAAKADLQAGPAG
jgi:hypothetical protein